MDTQLNRRKFVKKGLWAGAGLAVGLSAKSYGNILGANDRIHLAVAGLNSRGHAHVSAAQSFASKTRVLALCDVDNRVFKKVHDRYQDYLGSKVETYADVRILLENKDIDALTIATPDHWHAPMAIMAMNAGKHVFLEKPCCYNPQEGEWLMDVQRKTKMKLQVGNQQRSASTSMEMVDKIKEGVIGEVRYGKAWYANTRGSIGVGKEQAVPDWLDWELWQGPAPRKPYKDNLVHYNWHWFWHWGTGEINNNGLHELDICRWALGVDIPNEVTSSGGRFHFDDDWEFYDTQIASFTFSDQKMITWEGRSCNGHPFNKRSRGASIHGDNGSIVVDRNGYEIYDQKGKLIAEAREKETNAGGAQDLVGIGGLDNYHMLNFIEAIQKDQALNSPIDEAHKSNLLCHLGNMAQAKGGSLKIDEKTGQPLDDQAMSLWSREYEPGWEPVV